MKSAYEPLFKSAETPPLRSRRTLLLRCPTCLCGARAVRAARPVRPRGGEATAPRRRPSALSIPATCCRCRRLTNTQAQNTEAKERGGKNRNPPKQTIGGESRAADGGRRGRWMCPLDASAGCVRWRAPPGRDRDNLLPLGCFSWSSAALLFNMKPTR